MAEDCLNGDCTEAKLIVWSYSRLKRSKRSEEIMMAPLPLERGR